jgi:hypothetical protein
VESAIKPLKKPITLVSEALFFRLFPIARRSAPITMLPTEKPHIANDTIPEEETL